MTRFEPFLTIENRLTRDDKIGSEAKNDRISVNTELL